MAMTGFQSVSSDDARAISQKELNIFINEEAAYTDRTKVNWEHWKKCTEGKSMIALKYGGIVPEGIKIPLICLFN